MSPEELIHTIHQIKNNEDEETAFALPVRSQSGDKIGTLRAIDRTLSNKSEIIESLTKWRQTFMQYFLTQFRANYSRTGSWLDKIVLPADDRMLFLILDDRGASIGNFGICNVDPGEAELDNLIRGEQGGHPQLIFYSEVALLSWLYWGLGMNKVYLHVFSTNEKTINLHSRVGFLISKTQRLTKILDGEEIRFLPDTGQGVAADFEYLEMAMERDQFLRAQPWTEAVYHDLHKMRSPIGLNSKVTKG